MKTLETKKTIKIQGHEIVIKKLPLGKVAELLKDIGELPKEIAGLDKMGNDQLIAQLPMIIATALPSFAKLIVKAVDDPKIDQTFIETKCGLDEALEIISSILEVNNLAGIFATIKKIKALGTTGR